MKQSRRGFTLVEILVAMAVTIFILTILAQAFGLGADLFRTTKAVGDLNGSLRTAVNMLRSDLSADHFEGKRRLSDTKFWDLPHNGPPQQGYFFLYLPRVSLDGEEPNDADGLGSRRRTGHVIAGTAKARGNRQQDYYTTFDLSGGQVGSTGSPDSRYQQVNSFNSQWIEFCYFLSPVRDANNSAGGTPLFALYRQQRLVVANVDPLNWGAPQTSTGGLLDPTLRAYNKVISCTKNPSFPTFVYFNSPSDLTIPERRAAGGFPGTGPPVLTPLGSGEDLLLTDVLSFDVQVLFSDDRTRFKDPTDVVPPQQPRFDTWSQRTDDFYNYSVVPNPFSWQTTPRRIVALQITIRIWDAKSKLSRQVTMIQDM